MGPSDHGLRLTKSEGFRECIAALVVCGGPDPERALDRLMAFVSLSLLRDRNGRLPSSANAYDEFRAFVVDHDGVIAAFVASGGRA